MHPLVFCQLTNPSDISELTAVVVDISHFCSTSVPISLFCCSLGALDGGFLPERLGDVDLADGIAVNTADPTQIRTDGSGTVLEGMKDAYVVEIIDPGGNRSSQGDFGQMIDVSGFRKLGLKVHSAGKRSWSKHGSWASVSQHQAPMGKVLNPSFSMR